MIFTHLLKRPHADNEMLIKAKKHSKLTIHKMHGSINWKGLEYKHWPPDLWIELDDRENKKFHFVGSDKLLDRQPNTILQGKEDQVFEGRHEPVWMLPSFIKLFERKEMYEIWQSAIKVMSKRTDELIIIGYSFRPEDSNAYLLMASLSDTCGLTLIDPCYKEIKEKLGRRGLKVTTTYSYLSDYLSEYKFS